jgi:hypothetical protein
VLRRIFGPKRKGREARKDCIIRSFITCLLHHLRYQVKEDEMGGVCSTDGRDEKYIQILVGKLKGRDHLEHLGADGRIILQWMLGK